METILMITLAGAMIVLLFMSFKELDEDHPIAFIIWIVGMLLFILMSYESNNKYKEGQVDAMTGKIKYELKENTDKTKEWVKINK